MLPVLQELAPHFSNESLLISVATGHTIEEAQMVLLAIKKPKLFMPFLIHQLA